jgi:hypothetical protein
MNPWTALLESLHSSLVDELTERRPEPKLELGMPIRQAILGYPATGLSPGMLCPVEFSLREGENAYGRKGFALLVADTAGAKGIGLGADALWKALVKRAGGEFSRRGIQPRFGDLEVFIGKLEASQDPPGRVIWIPFKLNPGVVFLGVGV